LALARDPSANKFSQLTTSAFINHLSKSVCIAHAACGAVEFFLMVRALVSFSQVVK
jgi:hypothetical protein